MHDLSSADYAVLILLKNEGREISNTELNRVHGFSLVGPACARLNATGYIVSDTSRRPYKHNLTDSGAKLLDQPISIDDDSVAPRTKRSLGEKMLWAALLSIHNVRSSTATPIPLEERIRSAYGDLAAKPGAWIDLAQLRPLLAGTTRAEQDRALVRLLEFDDVRLEPEPHRHRLGDEDRAAAVRIGGEDRHKLAIGVR
ncbi:hypothetical protein OWR29_09395 [Actinoplanes sp. Pm04-4]|uniref:MarR family transcriptional regulator n=1 Tax=Paractinoplanes pyxinae TaxID=2997416 RepID=A0ABT4AVF2_9ACTN|nr:hypothetical protein [Actinoplanes pyxinae]MCY1138211.1 hypothetical protein [Actinoplanes pyxinae]